MKAIQYMSFHRDMDEANEMLDEWTKIDTFIGGRTYYNLHERPTCQVFFTENSPMKFQDGSRMVTIMDDHRRMLGIREDLS